MVANYMFKNSSSLIHLHLVKRPIFFNTVFLSGKLVAYILRVDLQTEKQSLATLQQTIQVPPIIQWLVEPDLAAKR